MSETIENPAPTPAPSPAPASGTFSAQYVQELREEAKRHRLAAAEHEAKAIQARDEAARRKDEADKARDVADKAAAEKITEATAAANRRIMMAELKAHAVKAGLVDLDGLKMLDLSTLKLNDAGELEGAEALIEAAKKSKPYLFGTPNSSHPAQPPGPEPIVKKTAAEMTDAEFDAAVKSRAWLK